MVTMAAFAAEAQTGLVIDSFSRNGEISWSNYPGAVEYRVEWAPDLTGTWTNSWSALNGIPADGEVYTVKVPMFYRIVAIMPDYARLLLHCDGSDGSTEFIDETGRHSATVIGDAQISVAEGRFGGSSAFFDGAGDYLEFPDSPDFDPGSQPFTIDFWLFSLLAGSGTQYIIGKSSPNGGQGYDIRLGGGRINVVGVNGWAVNIVTDPLVTAGVWHHVALSCTETTAVLFIDGTNSGTSARSAIGDTTIPLRIGLTKSYGGIAYNGYMDEIRYSLGIARWTEDFVVPSAPYEDD
jgi:hypothetical protein